MWQKFLAVATLALMLSAVPMSAAAQAALSVGDRVQWPAVSLIDGRTLPPDHFRGKPVIFEYWASWCPFCARQNPYIQKLALEAEGKNLEILTVSIDKNQADAKEYVEKHRYTFPVAMQTPELAKVFGKPKVIPLIIVVKADGTVAEIIPGEMFEEDVLDLIKYAP